MFEVSTILELVSGGAYKFVNVLLSNSATSSLCSSLTFVELIDGDVVSLFGKVLGEGASLSIEEEDAPVVSGESRVVAEIGVDTTLGGFDPLALVELTFPVEGNIVLGIYKCLVDASLHVPLDEIKVDKTLRFVEEPVEIMDREVKSLKRSRILLVKVHWNSKRGPEFTWEREDHMKSKYPQLFVDRVVGSAS
ncbi:hypothetical protein Tco_0448625 [Tanacetum coccineum]